MAQDASHRTQTPADRDSSVTGLPPSSANNANQTGRNVVREGRHTGHEARFVQPSSYLRPRGLSHPMTPVQPERAIDREERQGLVSNIIFIFCYFFFFFFPSSFALSRGFTSSFRSLDTPTEGLSSIVTHHCCQRQFSFLFFFFSFTKTKNVTRGAVLFLLF